MSVPEPIKGSAISAYGTNRTNRTGLTMSVVRGRSEVLAEGQNGANDPTATLAGHCGNRFDADSNPYQSTHLSRYNNDAS
jgi:hypothetical protein